MSERRRESHACFAVCLPGLAPIAAAELEALGVARPKAVSGGVEFRATTRQLYAANLWLRTATRVVVRVATFSARSFAHLEEAAEEILWHRWLGSDGNAVFRVTTTGSKLYHSDAIAQRLVTATGRPRIADGHDQLFVVRANRDRFTISVDSSGEALHRRGYRLEGAKAPLRETIAAAMLLASAWDPDTPLLDPFCGSGTIAIEAALLARQIAPGSARSFAFADWPGFEPGTWASVAGEARSRARDAAPAPIVGADRDEGAITAALANAERAGVHEDVVLVGGALSDAEPPAAAPGWIITNPPWGTRIAGGGDLRNLYARLGQVAVTRFAGWQLGMLVNDRRLAGHTGLSLEPRFATSVGGIDASFLAGAVPAADL